MNGCCSRVILEMAARTGSENAECRFLENGPADTWLKGARQLSEQARQALAYVTILKSAAVELVANDEILDAPNCRVEAMAKLYISDCEELNISKIARGVQVYRGAQ